MKKNLTELVFIVDKSGSMSGLEKDTIGGYNSLMEKQRKTDGGCVVTTVFFNHRYEIIHDRIDLRAISPITEKDYYVGGSTALLDAVGITIRKITEVQKHTAKEYRADKVLFVIITDGEENSSREYSAQKVKNMIEQQKKRYGWEFIFLGANIDAVQTAGMYGIDAKHAVDYVPDEIGTELNFNVMSRTISSFRESGTIPENCLDAIRKDMKKRGRILSNPSNK